VRRFSGIRLISSKSYSRCKIFIKFGYEIITSKRQFKIIREILVLASNVRRFRRY
jgi:hypothetical protein